MDSDKLTVQIDRFCELYPTDANAYALRAGTWKFDYERLDRAGIEKNILSDGRPMYCAETFPGFSDFDILELGCSDGYNTAGLEMVGAKHVTAIDANADGFLKACLLKNALSLKSKFLLGDFLQYIQTPGLRYDLVYASGILYHLLDPVDFILRCGKVSDNLFLWTFYHNAETIASHAYERQRFVDSEKRYFKRETFIYHKRIYDPEFVAAAKYQGGIESAAYWLSLDDLMRALSLAGFRILRTVPDSFNGIEALNIMATKAA